MYKFHSNTWDAGYIGGYLALWAAAFVLLRTHYSLAAGEAPLAFVILCLILPALSPIFFVPSSPRMLRQPLLGSAIPSSCSSRGGRKQAHWGYPGDKKDVFEDAPETAN
jgi:hypothetical protein